MLNEKWDITHFKAHTISALCCSFLKVNFVIGFLCVATLPESLFVSSVSQANGVDGSSRITELDPPDMAPHLPVQKSVTDSDFCVWVTRVICFFPETWLFKVFSPMLDSEKVFAHSSHFASVLPSDTDVNQALY